MSGIQRTTQTLRVLLPSGSAASEYPLPKQLRADFNECIGVTMYTTNNGGDANFRVELVDDNGQPIFEVVHNRELEGNTAVAVDQRYKELLFKSADKKVVLRVSTTQTLSADLVADFVFKLQK